MVEFNREYYETLMNEFGYNPIMFGQIDFSIGSLTKDDLQRRWLCHHGADIWAKAFSEGKKVAVLTGFGLSGVPHIGTLSQIFRSLTLQKQGVPVHMILGDLDAYNGKATDFSKTQVLAEKFLSFVKNLGFDGSNGSTLRNQFDYPEVNRTSYLIGNYMDDEMFSNAEEDLHEFYNKHGKVDKGMTYRRKLSLNLMIADFVDLYLAHGYDYVLIMLGVDEHQYVRFGQETVKRISEKPFDKEFSMHLAGMYSPMIKGFNNFPKMSKSFTGSGITVDMEPEEIRSLIMDGEGEYDKPENNVVYQMMASASYFSPKELKECYDACLEGGDKWDSLKSTYADMLIDVCSKWVK